MLENEVEREEVEMFKDWKMMLSISLMIDLMVILKMLRNK